MLYHSKPFRALRPVQTRANCVMLKVAECGGSAGHEANTVLSAVSETTRGISLKLHLHPYFEPSMVKQ